MNIERLAIDMIYIIAVCAIVIAFVKYSGITIPKPILIAIYAILAILAIIFLSRF